jgi:hypothetical protein
MTTHDDYRRKGGAQTLGSGLTQASDGRSVCIYPCVDCAYIYVSRETPDTRNLLLVISLCYNRLYNDTRR